MSQKKCAFVRSDKDGRKRCPFGLPITKACEHAGDSIRHMTPLEMVNGEEKQAQAIKANKRVYLYTRDDKRCSFAANIMEDYNSVNCNYGDNAEGVPLPQALEGSPLYAQTFSGIGLDGLYAFPLGFYADNNTSRNLFTGLFSLVGSVAPVLIKNAIEATNKNLWDRIENGDILLPKEQDELNGILVELNNFFKEN